MRKTVSIMLAFCMIFALSLSVSAAQKAKNGADILLCDDYFETSPAVDAEIKVSRYGGVVDIDEEHAELVPTDEISVVGAGRNIVPVRAKQSENGQIVITSAVSDGGSAEPTALTDRTKAVEFKYEVKAGGTKIGTLTVIVFGIYSPTDRTAAITDIKWSYSGQNTSSISCARYIEGDAGKLHMFYGGEYAKTFSYKIHYNGSISEV